jgi:DNA polymerase
VLQHLDSLARAGVTHLAVPRGVLPAVVETVAEPSAKPLRDLAAPPARNPLTSFQEAAPPVPEPTASKPPVAEKAPPAARPATVLSAAVPESLPADRTAALAIVNEKVKGCTRCAELVENRTQTVFGVGNVHAKIVFVGEAPGADEDRQGEPFVGRAGQLLNDIIRACRLTREEIYICNTLKCRPPNNRPPTEDECANCREYLMAQLRIIDPDYIVCWGAWASKSVLNSPLSIGKLRGKFYEHNRAKVLCTYHPSYLLRNPAAKQDVWKDMKFLFLDMGIDLTAK